MYVRTYAITRLPLRILIVYVIRSFSEPPFPRVGTLVIKGSFSTLYYPLPTGIGGFYYLRGTLDQKIHGLTSDHWNARPILSILPQPVIIISANAYKARTRHIPILLHINQSGYHLPYPYSSTSCVKLIVQ